MRPEVKRAAAAMKKLGDLTMPEVREMLRTILAAALGDEPWTASVYLRGVKDAAGRSPLLINWEEKAFSS